MDPRKRPADRGQSPPEKRNRSTEHSVSGKSKVSRNAIPIQHAAPQTPSMLPANSNRTPGQETDQNQPGGHLSSFLQNTPHGVIPTPTMALQRMKARQQEASLSYKLTAAGENRPSTILTDAIRPLMEKLESQQIEIDLLKQEREIFAMRLQKLEAQPPTINRPTEDLHHIVLPSDTRDGTIADSTEASQDIGLLKSTQKGDVATKEDELIEKIQKIAYSTVEGLCKKHQEESQHALQEVTKHIEKENDEMRLNFNMQIDSISNSVKDLRNLSKQMETISIKIKDIDTEEINSLSRKIEAVAVKSKDIDWDANKASKTTIALEKEMDDMFEKHGRLKLLLDNLDADIEDFIGSPKQLEAAYKKTGKTILQQLHDVVLEQERASRILDDLRSSRIDQSEVKDIQTDHSRLSAEQKRLSTRLDTIEESVNRLGAHCPDERIMNTSLQAHSNQEALESAGWRVERVEEEIRKLSQNSSSNAQTLAQLSDIRSRIQECTTLEVRVNQRLQTMEHKLENELVSKACDSEPRINQPGSASTQKDTEHLHKSIEDLWASTKDLSDNLEQIERDLHEGRGRIDILQQHVPNMFREKFDTFQRSFTDQNNLVFAKLRGYEEDIANLREQILVLNSSPGRMDLNSLSQEQLYALVQDTKKLAENVASLKASLDTEVNTRTEDIKQVKVQLATRADFTFVNKQMDAFKLTLRSLQHQYDNITTDDLHQRMVHWFLQNYPSNANVVQHYSALKEDVARLYALNNEVTWIQAHKQELIAVLQNAQHVQALVSSAEALRRLPETSARIDEAVNYAQNALNGVRAVEMKAEEQLQSVQSMKEAICALQAASKEMQFVANNGKDSDQRVDRDDEIKHKVDALEKHTQQIQHDANKLRADFDTLSAEHIEPNHPFLAWLASLFAVVAQLQQIVSVVRSKQTPQSKPINWAFNFNEQSSLEPQGITQLNDDGHSRNDRSGVSCFNSPTT